MSPSCLDSELVSSLAVGVTLRDYLTGKDIDSGDVESAPDRKVAHVRAQLTGILTASFSSGDLESPQADIKSIVRLVRACKGLVGTVVLPAPDLAACCVAAWVCRSSTGSRYAVVCLA